MIYIKNNKLIKGNDNQKHDRKSLYSQASMILRKMLSGAKVNRFEAMKEPIGSAKLPTRMSEIRTALAWLCDVKVIKNKSQRGSDCFTYYLEREDIEKIKRLVNLI